MPHHRSGSDNREIPGSSAPDWRPRASIEMLRRRARLLERIREFFRERDVTEVTTPILTPSGVTDIHIESMTVESGCAYLRTSPEYYHKRLLAAGMGDLYEIGPVFRAGERGRRHRPEFTLLEWYRVGWSWRALADEVVALLQLCLRPDTGDLGVRFLPWPTLFERVLGVDPLKVHEAELRELAPDAPGRTGRDMLLDLIFATRIQPTFPTDTLTVIHDYPASQAALARLHPDNRLLAERFEVFAGDIELANGYRELTDPQEQRLRFAADNQLRQSLGRRSMPVDEAMLAALQCGLPECSGVALGMERLLMAALGSCDIARVMAFPGPAAE